MFRFFRWLTLTAALLSAFAGRGQTPAPATPTDVVVKRDGTEIAAHVDEVTPEVVKYHRADNLKGPLFTVFKSELFMIRYANGTKDVFTTMPPRPAEPAPAVAPAPVAAPAPIYYPPPPPPRPLTAEDSVFQQVAANGPRIGVTVIGNGKLRDKLRDEYDATNVISQFGWQFETRLFQLPQGPSGLLEFVPLVGGLEQGLFLPSLSMVLGLRGQSGLEIGFGPNVSLAGAGLVVAAGHTVQGRYLNVPVNFAIVPSREGTRFSMLIGFTYKERRRTF